MSKTSTPAHVSQLPVLCINPKFGCRADALLVLGFISIPAKAGCKVPSLYNF